MPVLPVLPGQLTLVAAVATALLAVSCVTPAERRGPIGVRNQHPLQLTALRMVPSTARPILSGEIEVGLDAAYSSLFLSSRSGGDAFTMDGEILRTGLQGRYGLMPDLQLSVEVPFAHTGGGFLDQFIEGYHGIFGLENGNRANAPRDRFTVEAQQGGRQIYRMEPRTYDLLDVPIGAMWRVLRHRGIVELDLAVRGAIELPTGAQANGFGNGGLDYAIGAVGEIAWGPLSLNAHLARSFVHTPDRAVAAGFRYRDSTSSGFSLEAALTGDTAVIVQVEMDQAILRNLRGVNAESDQWLLWLGLRSQLADGLAFEFSFGEDLTLNAPPDFTVYMGLRARFAGGRQSR